MDGLAPYFLDSLRSLIDEDAVVNQLAKAEPGLTRAFGTDQALATIQRFLVTACWVCAGRFLPPTKAPGSTATRSEKTSDLMMLAERIGALAKSLGQYGTEHRHATAVSYLAERHLAGNPPGFSSRRKGWAGASFDSTGGHRVEELLACLAEDVLEEAGSIRESIQSRRQVGGRAERYYPQINMLGLASMRLSTEQPAVPDARLVFEVMCILLGPDLVDLSTIRKRLK
jgi:hypothetical protein